jgi:hypothetical protein
MAVISSSINLFFLRCYVMVAAAAAAHHPPSATGVGEHVRWMTFYGLNASEQHSWSNLAPWIASGADSSVVEPGGPLLKTWDKYRLPGLLDVEDVGGGFSDGLYIRRGAFL